ncbi:MAG: DUF1415 domain-containing protein [Pseudomonadota bacterium]|nr:DUF1415 domain-containing protein [Pseudomonadota bacterium]
MLVERSDIDKAMHHWLEQVVIGLNLCPFASLPHLQKRVRIISSDCTDQTCLLDDLSTELERMADHSPKELETTLIAIPEMLHDFYDYNQFLDLVDHLLVEQGWEGHFQVASFHPDYQFGGTQPDDTENLTNRSPYPVLHIIREASLEQAIKHYPNPEQIPERNIETVNNLTPEQKATLFPYLSK